MRFYAKLEKHLSDAEKRRNNIPLSETILCCTKIIFSKTILVDCLFPYIESSKMFAYFQKNQEFTSCYKKKVAILHLPSVQRKIAVWVAKKPDKIGLFRGRHIFCLHSMVRMFITNLKSILKIRLKAHIFPRTFADLLPL